MSRTDRTDFARKYGPWAVVTGASDGIGRELARSLARRKLDLVLVARRQSRLNDLAEELAGKHGIQTRGLALDLADRAAPEELHARTAELAVGLFVAAAGFGASGAFIQSDLAIELEMLDVNCRAVLGSLHHYARRFAGQGRGGIVLMSSLLAFQGVAGSANYAATKAYIQSLVEGLRDELRLAGVDIVASAPGPIKSGFAARAGMKMSLGQGPQSVADATLNALGRSITVRPGALSKGLELSFIGLPRRARSLILSRIMAGMISPG